MGRRQRLVASLAFFGLVLGGSVLSGFYRSAGNAQSRGEPVAVGAPAVSYPARPVKIRFIDCSKPAERVRYEAECRGADEHLRESMKRWESSRNRTRSRKVRGDH